MGKKFQSLPRLIQLILLLIPVVNWVTEIIVRVSTLLERPDLHNVLGAIIVLIFGLPLCWIDFICVLLFKHLIFARV
jgi:hypothetical protein